METNPGVEAVLRNIAAAEAHVGSEYVYDLAGTMATVGASPHYAVTAEPGVIGVISGRDGVSAFYENAHKYAVPQASRFLTQIAGDWFLFVENMPTRRWVADSSLRTVHTATLLVTGRDGVLGEFIWERPAGQAAAADALLPLGQFRSVSRHEEFLAAVCAGDRTSIEALLDPASTWAERDYLSEAEGGAILELRGAAAAANHLAQWHARYRPERVSILNRHATDWYVFAEELWVVRPEGGERRQLRKAVIYPVGAIGKLQGVVGFGTDPEPASSLADRSLGQAFWPADDKEPSPRNRPPRAM
jgi:hypothetical protein